MLIYRVIPNSLFFYELSRIYFVITRTQLFSFCELSLPAKYDILQAYALNTQRAFLFCIIQAQHADAR